MKKEEDLKYKKAAALKYKREKDQAPVIVAKGRGIVAQRIVEIAKECHIPIYEDHDLTEALSLLDINKEIPEELYQVVAEVLVFVYSLNQKWKKGIYVK
ncbi:EscU/YscU/HrcU family type III secretion system export apparatus switch protein [bacterium]|nr:EscU/YscU/HrcU family type III secretion system export apparatus switch protein [bacterium]MBU0900187.1 EscU/YscU/HrcU family type III secretion system export apparatus switch protein [bacterium]MBU1153476.1 EscU/YscU/HrcU family type III secretion system export apparatus switch protein [bacterium]MBU1782110.1 EscU/YscU/HrcU family type III secretion system export apparatus switch protein [bacterium]MBU2599034.1 EscU/YscU/HrcU family type III secretion system export apparatus switch protein 